jgi:DNA polymerase bacteriophage-type
MGAAKFQTQLETFGVSLEQEECQRIINVYRSTYEMIPRLWYSAGDALEAIQGNQSTFLDDSNKIQVLGRDGVLLPNGLRLRYPNLRREMNEDGREETVYDTRKGRAVMQTRIYGGKVIENVCQALARIVIGQHLLKVSKRYKVVMTVHDAIGCIAPVEEKDEAFRYIDECMRERPEWAMTLPLDCEGGYGPAYGKVETVDISR